MMENANNQPPSVALRFFRFFCLPEVVDDIEGDLRQYHSRRCEAYGRRRADWMFRRDVLLLFRPGLIRSFKFSQKLNIMDHFKHSLLVSFRNYKKYSGSFLINLLGLTSGLASVLFIYLWVADEVAMNKHHVNDDRLYQLLENVDQGTGMITRLTTAGPTSKALVEEFPEVEKAITTTWISDYTLQFGDKSLKAEGMWAGEEYFEMFTLPLLQGRASEVLKDKSSLVMSDELAMRIFGTTEDVVGKTVLLQRETPYTVTGIYKKHPRSASLAWDFMLPFKTFYDNNEWVQNWFNTAPRTYVLFKPNADVVAFNDKVQNLIIQKTDSGATHRKPFAAKFSDRYLYGSYENGQQAGGRIEYVRMFSAVAFFVLMIACINFMNLSTARASRRLKEVGIKKTVGASRRVLIFQFLAESMLIVAGSMAIALLLVWLLTPQFNVLTDKRIVLELDGTMIMAIVLVTVFTGLVAGSYPALYLSGFSPAKVLKGRLHKSTGESWARRGLVTFQFTLSVILIVAVVVVFRQLDYTQSKNLGYEKDNKLILYSEGGIEDSVTFHRYLQEIRKVPGVTGAFGSEHNMTGHNGGTYGVGWPGKDPNDRTEFENMFVAPGFIEMMEIEMVEGRSFSEDLSSDGNKIIFNEAGIAFMGIEDPIGKKVTLWGDEVEIVGVTKDFHFNSLHQIVKPVFIRPYNSSMDYIIVDMAPGTERDVVSTIDEIHAGINPGFDLGYSFLNERYQRMYYSEQRVSSLANYFAGIAIIISCLGLFGLASFTLERRSKEIGIRKILGSSQIALLRLLTLDLTKMVVVAIVIGIPVSYLLTQNWLQNFAFRINLEWWFFAGAGLVTVVVALATVSIQAIKAAFVNPVKYLRDE